MGSDDAGPQNGMLREIGVKLLRAQLHEEVAGGARGGGWNSCECKADMEHP